MVIFHSFRRHFICLLTCVCSTAYAFSDHVSKHPFYFSVVGGYGSTTWQGLVPSVKNQGAAMVISTPKEAREGGFAGGIVAGYEFNDFFALEASYLRFPEAKLTFDSMSLVAFENNGLQELYTHTETIGVAAKIMLGLPHSHIRVFSSFGAADVHRYDQLTESWRISPTFGFGFNYLMSPRFMAELGFDYISGYGESEINPAASYIPFLYGVFFSLAYRFGV